MNWADRVYICKVCGSKFKPKDIRHWQWHCGKRVAPEKRKPIEYFYGEAQQVPKYLKEKIAGKKR